MRYEAEQKIASAEVAAYLGNQRAFQVFKKEVEVLLGMREIKEPEPMESQPDEQDAIEDADMDEVEEDEEEEGGQEGSDGHEDTTTVDRARVHRVR